MKSSNWRNILITVVLLCTIALGGYAFAEVANDLHRYLDIPFEKADPEMVAKILSEQKGVTFELSQTGVLSGNASGLNEFGYSFDVQFDFDDNFDGIYRIRLISSQPSRISKAECVDRIPSDLCQFVDMEAQLNELYGEPDVRYFKSSRMNENEKYIRYMFPEENWSIADLQYVCETDLLLKAYSVWDNVVLEMYVNLLEPYGEGTYYSYITLYYYPDVDTIDFMRETSVEMYPV